MKPRLFGAILTTGLLLTASATVLAQRPARSDWSAVQSLPAGTELVLKKKDGRTIRGRLGSVSETTVGVTQAGKLTDLQRGDIQRVYTVKGRSRGRSSLLGAGSGAGIGVGAGLALYLPARDDIVGVIVPAFGLVGAGIGAGIGALVGGGRKQTLIYEAK